MTNDPRETFLVQIRILRRHRVEHKWVLVDSNVMGEAWVCEDALRREDKNAREEAKKCSQ